MKTTVREARKLLTKLDQILPIEGEVEISRRGIVVGRILPPVEHVKRIPPSHRTLRESMPRLTQSESIIREDRDQR